MSTAKQWNSKMPFPQDSDYKVRITSVEYGDSKRSGNPMLTLELEIVAPDEKEVNGEMIGVSGVEPQPTYLTLQNLKDAEKDENAKKRASAFLSMAFPDKPEYAKSFDFENPQQEILDALKGRIMWATCYAKAEPQRKQPTKAEVEEAAAKGIPAVGAIMKNPMDGSDLVFYKVQVGEFFGLAPAPTNKPF